MSRQMTHRQGHYLQPSSGRGFSRDVVAPDRRRRNPGADEEAGGLIMARFQDWTNPNSYADIDPLAATAYTETGSRWWTMIARANVVDNSNILWTVGELGIDYRPRIYADIQATGTRRMIVWGPAVSKAYSPSGNLDDGAWHVIQWLDVVSGAGPYSGTLYAKYDDNARTNTTAYTRWAADANFPVWMTLGKHRFGATGAPQTPQSGDFDALFFAQVTGAFPSDVQMTSVSDAFFTGGGKDDLSVVSDAIGDVVTALGVGTYEWGCALDGVSDPYVDTLLAGAPLYNNVVFSRATGL